MARTLASAMVTHLAGDDHTRCNMLKIKLSDGTFLCVTDHDRPITYDLGDGDGSLVYSTSESTGIILSDLTLVEGFSANDYEVTGPIVPVSEGLTTRVFVLGGRFESCEIWRFQVNYANLTGAGAIKMSYGYPALVALLGDTWKITVHNEISKFGLQAGEITSPFCRTYFGSTKCTKTPVADAESVVTPTSTDVIVVTTGGGRAADFFDYGFVTFTSGVLNGIKAEIYSWAADGTIEFYEPLPDLPAAADTLTVTQGCARTPAACQAYSNMVNFRGEPDLPGSDKVLPYHVPTSTG